MSVVIEGVSMSENDGKGNVKKALSTKKKGSLKEKKYMLLTMSKNKF